MDISNIHGSHIAKYESINKLTHQNKTGNRPTGKHSESNSDQVNLSDQAKTLSRQQQILTELMKTPEVDEALVQRVREEIAQGKFNTNEVAEKVAEEILKFL